MPLIFMLVLSHYVLRDYECMCIYVYNYIIDIDIYIYMYIIQSILLHFHMITANDASCSLPIWWQATKGLGLVRR